MTGIIISTPPAVEVPPGNNASNPSSLPPVTYRYAVLNVPQTWTALQTFPPGTISIQAGDIQGFGTDTGVLFSDGGAIGNSSTARVATDSGYQFFFLGDNYADAISRWTGPHKPLLFMDRLVNWDQINDNTCVDFTTITALNSTSNQYASFNCKITTSNTAFNFNHLVAFEDQKVYVGSGTLTEDWSVISFPTYNGPVTNRRTFYVQDAQGAGALTNQYGFYCASLAKGSNNWAFYSAGLTKSYMGGNLLLSTNLITAPTAPKLTISKNAATAANDPGANTLIYGVNADGSSSVVQMDAYGTSVNGGFVSRAARGTAAAPTQTKSGDFLFGLNAYGYNSTGGFAGGSAWGQAVFAAVATQDYTSGSSGTAFDFWLNADGTGVASLKARIGSGLMVGTTTDPGVGRVNALNGYDVNGSVVADNAAWTVYSPSLTSTGGAFTSAGVTGRYKRMGKTVFVQGHVTITTVGSASGQIIVGLPFTAAAFVFVGNSGDLVTTGASGTANTLAISATTVKLFPYNASSYVGAAVQVAFGLTYEVP